MCVSKTTIVIFHVCIKGDNWHLLRNAPTPTEVKSITILVTFLFIAVVASLQTVISYPVAQKVWKSEEKNNQENN